MFAIIGMVAVVGCVIGSYVAMGGKLAVLNQPFEVVIIFGSGISAFIVSNPIRVVKGAFGKLAAVFKGPQIQEGRLLGTANHAVPGLQAYETKRRAGVGSACGKSA